MINAKNLHMWEENPRNKDYEMLTPSNNAWFQPTIEHFYTRDKKIVNRFINGHIQTERPRLKSRQRNGKLADRITEAEQAMLKEEEIALESNNRLIAE